MGAPPPPPSDPSGRPGDRPEGSGDEASGAPPPPPSDAPPPGAGDPPPAQDPPPAGQGGAPPGQTGWSAPPPAGQWGAGAPPPAGQPAGRNGVAIGALVCGIVAVIFGTVLGFFILTLPIAFIVGVVAVVLGIIGMRKAKVEGVGRGQALTGLITGAVAIVASLLWGFAFGALFSGASDVFDADFQEELERMEEEIEQQ